MKLADFGSCKSVYSKHPFTEYISTRWYRAPECLLTDGFYDYRMDMWSVGCVMYEVMRLERHQEFIYSWSHRYTIVQHVVNLQQHSVRPLSVMCSVNHLQFFFTGSINNTLLLYISVCGHYFPVPMNWTRFQRFMTSLEPLHHQCYKNFGKSEPLCV